MKYDYLIVGAGLSGAVFAQRAHAMGKSVLVIEKRDHLGGNVYTENINGIDVHKYGAHIFHTDNKKVWDYINQFSTFNNYVHQVKANYHDEIYDLPFNLNTFKQIWGIDDVDKIKEIIVEQTKDIKEIKNLEQQCISMVGKDIYEKLVKGYTEKQWGRKCDELPSFIIKRLPLRFEYNNNYFNDKYQGIPIGGYTKLVERLLEGIEVRLNNDYLNNKEEFDKMADKIVFTGPIDAYFAYCYGPLQYRLVKFENETLDIPNYQGMAVLNYTDKEIPYTRIIEHKWFNFGKDEDGNDIENTIISKEYSSEWKIGDEPYYPVNDEANTKLYQQYKQLADKLSNVIFIGRLAEYKYYDMDDIIARVLETI